MFDMIKQQSERGKINHLLCGLIGDFVVSCKSTEAIQPGECPFHNPSKRFWSKAACPVWSGTDFYVDIEIPLDVIYQLASVSAADKTLFYRGPRVRYLLTNRMRNTGVIVGIEPIVTLTVAPLDALGIKCHDRGCGGLLTFATYLHDEFFYTVIQISFCSPFMEIPIDRLPFGKVMRQHAPLATADQNIKDCLEYGAKGIFAVSAIIFKEYFVYIRPLPLGQMCLIEAEFMHTNRFSSTNTLIEGLLCLIMFNLV